MGATDFYEETWAETAKEAYAALCEEAVFEMGHDSYNGTISTTFGYVPFVLPKEWKGKEQDYASELIDTRSEISKWGNCGYLIVDSKDSFDEVPYATTAKRTKTEGARKWKTVYTVIGHLNPQTGQYTLEKSFDTQGEAESFAKAYVIKNNCTVDIKIEKKLTNAKELFVTFSPKSKRVHNENGLKKFLFFGWAAN